MGFYAIITNSQLVSDEGTEDEVDDFQYSSREWVFEKHTKLSMLLFVFSDDSYCFNISNNFNTSGNLLCLWEIGYGEWVMGLK